LNVPITDAYNLNYFWKNKLCTSEYISKKIENNLDIKKYLPENFKIKRLSRSFLFTLLYHVAPDFYSSLKRNVESENENNRMKKLESSYVEVDEDICKSILEKKELKV
jgi:hypothetical protein